MQVKRICKACKQEYYVDKDDNINLCHTCYLFADRQIKEGKIKDFDEYKYKLDPPTFKHKIEKISVIKVNDMSLVNLFGMCDREEIFLEDDMNDYILDEIEDGNIDEEDIKDIKGLQEIIRKELETATKVKVEYKKDI